MRYQSTGAGVKHGQTQGAVSVRPFTRRAEGPPSRVTFFPLFYVKQLKLLKTVYVWKKKKREREYEDISGWCQRPFT